MRRAGPAATPRWVTRRATERKSHHQSQGDAQRYFSRSVDRIHVCEIAKEGDFSLRGANDRPLIEQVRAKKPYLRRWSCHHRADAGVERVHNHPSVDGRDGIVGTAVRGYSMLNPDRWSVTCVDDRALGTKGLGVGQCYRSVIIRRSRASVPPQIPGCRRERSRSAPRCRFHYFPGVRSLVSASHRCTSTRASAFELLDDQGRC